MKKIRKPRGPVSSDAIARMADQDLNVSRQAVIKTLVYLAQRSRRW